MPELPEVETIRRDLARRLPGARIVAVWRGDAPGVDPGIQALTGRTLAPPLRRGKYLALPLDDGRLLAIHLRMSGRLFLAPPGEPRDPYVRAEWTLEDLPDGGRGVLRFRDVRKFGQVRILDPSAWADLDRRLGPEPLAPTFTVDALAARLRGRRSLKGALLDQSVVAGLGNIYVDEVLWAARLHPLRRAGDLSPAEVGRLWGAIRTVLAAATAARGTTFRDYRDGRGEQGRFQAQLQVHRRAGQPCPRCGTPIERIRVVGRGTYLCPRCQPLGS